MLPFRIHTCQNTVRLTTKNVTVFHETRCQTQRETLSHREEGSGSEKLTWVSGPLQGDKSEGSGNDELNLNQKKTIYDTQIDYYF